MNSNIRNHYHKLFDDGNVPLWKQKEAVYAAIRGEDAELLDKALNGLSNSEDDWDDDASPIVFALREMASCDIIRVLVEHGYKLPYLPDLLPWNGSPEEIISLMLKDKGEDKGKVFSYFVYSVC